MFRLTTTSLDTALLRKYVLCLGFYVSYIVGPNGKLSLRFTYNDCTLQRFEVPLHPVHQPSLLGIGTESPSFRYLILYRLYFLYLCPSPGSRPQSLLFHDRESLTEMSPGQRFLEDMFTVAQTRHTALREEITLAQLSSQDVYSALRFRLSSVWI